MGAVERGEHRLLRGLRARVEEQLQLEDRGVAEVQRAQQLCVSHPAHTPTLPLHQQGVRVQQDALVELQVLQHAALRGEPSSLPYARRQCQVLLLEVALGVHRAAVALRLSGNCSAYHQVLHETLALRLVEVLARHQQALRLEVADAVVQVGVLLGRRKQDQRGLQSSQLHMYRWTTAG